MPKQTESDSNKLVKYLDTNKVTRPDGISTKFVKMSTNVIDSHLSSITVCDLSKNKYS